VIENTFLTGADCYALRCAYLHQGIDDTEGQPARETLNKFHFTTMQMHRLMAFDMLTLNVRRFCLEFCGAADRWAEERGGDARVADELGRLLTIQSGVFSPHPRVQNVQCAPDPECASRGERPSCN